MKRVLKWMAIILVSIISLAVISGGVLYAIGGTKFDPPEELPAETLAAPSGSTGIVRGAHLAATHGCTECHGAQLQGQVMVDAPPFRVVASNLTGGAGGVAPLLDELGWERAIRHGIGADGRALAIMPSEAYTYLSDDEVAAIIAWLESLPPVDNELPETEIRPLGRIIAATGGFEPVSAWIDHAQPHLATAPAPGATIEYGGHRARTLCMACHGEDLNGQQPPNPESPFAPSLHPASHWTLEQFTTALRTGMTPARQLDSAFMPWPAFANMTDTEIQALHLYLSSLPDPAPAPTQ